MPDTVDTNSPLPAIQYESGKWLPTLVLNAWGSSLTKEMTLDHLVLVLKSLPPEQLDAVIDPVVCCPLAFQLADEKARAEHAEKLLGLGVVLPEQCPASAPDGYGYEVLATLKALGFQPPHDCGERLRDLAARAVDAAIADRAELEATRAEFVQLSQSFIALQNENAEVVTELAKLKELRAEERAILDKALIGTRAECDELKTEAAALGAKLEQTQKQASYWELRWRDSFADLERGLK